MHGENAWCYATRIVPALSVIILAILMILSFIAKPFGRGEKYNHQGEATIGQWLLSAYLVVLHAASLVFPVRVCYSLSHVMKKINESATVSYDKEKNSYQSGSLDQTKGSMNGPSLLFVLIIPAYKEDLDTMETTLRVLSRHSQAKCYHVRFYTVRTS